MDTLYRLLEWNPVQVGSTFQGGGEEERAPEGGRDWATSVERGKGGDEGGDGRRKGEAKEETGKNEVLL